MKQPGQEAAVAADLHAVLETCRWIGLLLAPLLPDLSQRLLSQLGEVACSSDAGLPASDGIAWPEALGWGLLPSGRPLPEPSPIMQRLELDGPL